MNGVVQAIVLGMDIPAGHIGLAGPLEGLGLGHASCHRGGYRYCNQSKRRLFHKSSQKISPPLCRKAIRGLMVLPPRARAAGCAQFLLNKGDRPDSAQLAFVYRSIGDSSH